MSSLIFDEGASLKPAKTPRHEGLTTARKAVLGSVPCCKSARGPSRHREVSESCCELLPLALGSLHRCESHGVPPGL